MTEPAMKGEKISRLVRLLFCQHKKLVLFFAHNTKKAYGLGHAAKDQGSWKEQKDQLLFSHSTVGTGGIS
jgi:hypothetical protein